MSAKKKGLGRGLSALLSTPDQQAELLTPEAAEKKPTGVASIPVAQIEPNPFQPRTEFSEEALNELIDSIKMHGLIQPITVRKVSAGKYQLISGERRWRASKEAGLEEIPAYVRTADDQGMLEMALIENTHRENLNPIEVAINYQRLMEECNLTQEKLSERVGKERATVANYLRLLKLPDEIKIGLTKQLLSMGHARALINIADPQKQLKIFSKILEDGLSVSAVEDLARSMNKAASGKKADDISTFDYTDEVAMLNDILHANVEIKESKKGNGKIIINYSSKEDLQRILSALK